MSYATHCDRDGCNTWQRETSSFPPFLKLSGTENLLGQPTEWVMHFCCTDCLFIWAGSNSEPTEVIP